MLENRCYCCFNEALNENGICPVCGYDNAKNREAYPLALPAGSILYGRYIIGKVLGQGGFGITYLAQDHQTKERVAIKEFFPDTMATRIGNTTVTPFSGARGENFDYGKISFLDEAKTMADFNGNPNIAGVQVYFEENGTAYFVMEYVEGTSFQDYIKYHGGRISWEETVKVILPVLDALSAVHEKGIIHRDVTPDNIYITSDGRVKLLDFGAARYSLGNVSRSLDVILKHGFAPKEQYSRRGRQGPYTDVYSVCATIYYAITGVKLDDAIDRAEEDSMPFPIALGAKISQKQEDALLKGMAINAEDRYQSASELKMALKSHGVKKSVNSAYSNQTHKKASTDSSENQRASKNDSASTEDYPGVMVFGRLLGKGEKPIMLDAASYYTGKTTAGGKLLLTDTSLSFSAHALNVGRKEARIELVQITDVATIDDLPLCILVKTNIERHLFVLHAAKKRDEWIRKIKLAVSDAKRSSHQKNIDKAIVLMEKADAAYEKKRGEEAIAYLDEALLLDASNHNVWNKLGRAYRLCNNFDRARECYENALNIKPGAIDVIANLGALEIFCKNYKLACQYCKQAFEAGAATPSDNAIYAANYAIALAKLGNMKEAFRVLEIARTRGYSNYAKLKKEIEQSISEFEKANRRVHTMKQMEYSPESDETFWGQNKYKRSDIDYIRFKDTLENVPRDAWDVSKAQDRSIMAWVVSGTMVVASNGTIAFPRDSSHIFANFCNLAGIDFGSCIDTSGVTNMSWMFYGCESLTTLDLTCFDTSRVNDMSSMFNFCVDLIYLDLSGFKTSNVTKMSSMFFECESLTYLDLSAFDTSNVTTMMWMFNGCSDLKSLDASGFNTANVVNMNGMFDACLSLTHLDISGFDASNVTDMYGMFILCDRLTNLNCNDPKILMEYNNRKTERWDFKKSRRD